MGLRGCPCVALANSLGQAPIPADARLQARFVSLASNLQGQIIMFLLNNIHNRDYDSVYPHIKGVRFDLSDDQVNNTKNSDWDKIGEGSIVCVVRRSNESANISTFYRVDRKFKTDVPDENGSFQHVIVGHVEAKLEPPQDMTAVLNKFRVFNKYLPDNKFSIGFNVADLGDHLASLRVTTKGGREATIGELEA